MDSLVSTAWLAEHLGDPDLIVLDASSHLPATGRDARAEFGAGHVPGACFLDLASLTDRRSPVPNALPTGAQIAERLAGFGWKPGTRVVLYDDSEIKASARAWFALRRAGVASAILDGGLGQWRAEGRPMEAGARNAEPAAAPHALRTDDSCVRSKADMIGNLANLHEQVVDARDWDRFTGKTRDLVHDLPGGHIPGARQLWFRDLYNPDGTFRSDDELRAAFLNAGIDPSRPIVASCGSGVTASVLLFALHRLGAEEAALYDGSWSEWGADPATPKETGPA